MPIRHKFQSAVADSADTTLASSSEWNDNHNFPPFILALNASGVAFTNLVSGITEMGAHRRVRIDLTQVSEVRFTAMIFTAGNTGKVKVQWSTDETTWQEFGTAAEVDMPLKPVGVRSTAWLALVAGAKADVVVRIVLYGGDGVEDPNVSNLTMQYR